MLTLRQVHSYQGLFQILDICSTYSVAGCAALTNHPLFTLFEALGWNLVSLNGVAGWSGFFVGSSCGGWPQLRAKSCSLRALLAKEVFQELIQSQSAGMYWSLLFGIARLLILNHLVACAWCLGCDAMRLLLRGLALAVSKGMRIGSSSTTWQPICELGL